MNKRNWIALVLGLIVVFAFAGCGSTDTPTKQKTPSDDLPQSQADSQDTDSSQGAGDLSNQNTDFNFESKKVLLNSGYEMPIIGLGTWTQDDETTENSVYHALADGYRLIDTARYYGNEVGVGKGVQRAINEGIVTREDVFITSKIVPFGFDDYTEVIDESLAKLGMEYVDLMLIHQPGTDEKELYKAMEQAVKDGKIHSIGISNYYTAEDFERVTEDAEIMPAVIQNEYHPYYQDKEMLEYAKQYGTVMESYYPFGGRGHTKEMFSEEILTDIAGNHQKTAAQVLVRWHLQSGFIVIPGSSNPEHIAENYAVFDFELSDDEMEKIAALNENQRFGDW